VIEIVVSWSTAPGGNSSTTRPSALVTTPPSLGVITPRASPGAASAPPSVVGSADEAPESPQLEPSTAYSKEREMSEHGAARKRRMEPTVARRRAVSMRVGGENLGHRGGSPGVLRVCRRGR